MNATKLFALTVFTAVAGAAFAGETGGSLIRTGEAYDTPSGQYVFPSTPSTLTRAEMQAEVTRARVDGTLIAAGEAASWSVRSVYDTPSTLARADVKAQVLQARLDGTLIPAGEAYAFSGPRATGGTSLAQARISR